KANFTTWLKNTAYLDYDDDVLVIGVANIFTKEWLENKYHEEILKTCRTVSPTLKSILYKVSSSKKEESEFKKIKIKNAPDEEAPTTTSFEKPSSRYTFGNFVVGGNNRLAHAAALAVAKNPGGSYNPLFLYGGVGLGKTHLMQAIGNQVKKDLKDKKVVYVPSESFTNDLINAIRARKVNAFKDKYREIDVLLVDDVQFIAGKEQTQEEFFHTFNHLYEAGKQIVLCSDRPPRAISTLEERLSSRFEWGMIADVQPPDLETRVAILQHNAAKAGVEFEMEVYEEIAASIQHNVRELEGALTRLVAHCQIHNEQPTKQLIEEILGSILNNPYRQSVTHKKILSTISKFYNITQTEITGKKRNKEIVLPRQVAIYFMRKDLSISYPKIGSIMGGRDHTTIMHGYEKIEKLMKEDEELMTAITKLKEMLYME
ncbi:chromosomal replication initiator protein DnaA, partial [Patescibacteria group bacterium]|nr:chromosomal replication initiator protein DnaA [Patescibacteria group bacterium]